MNVQLLSSRFLAVSQRFSGLLLSRSYAKPVKKAAAAAKVGKTGPVVEKVKFTVEKDPKKLVNYVCGSNVFAEGEDVKLKPESEYPDWLWKLHIGPPKKLEEIDPDSKEYWRKVRRMGLRQHNAIEKSKRRYLY